MLALRGYGAGSSRAPHPTGRKANVIQIDGTVDQDIMHEYKIAAYPCWLLFKDGKLAWRDYGSKPLGELEHMVRDFI